MPAEPAARQRVDWMDWLRSQDEDGSDALAAYVAATRDRGPLAPGQRELVLFVAALSRNIRPSAVAHGGRALAAGITMPEMVHAVRLTAMSGGLPCAVLGMQILADLDTSSKPDTGTAPA
jgi:alkylhydroperoxidase/carboxymuconolactone decarboxylase family protein YurZ